MFALHPRLSAGSHHLGTTCRCHLLLKDNAHFPWILVVPEVDPGIEELHQLPADRYAEVTGLVRATSTFVADHFQPAKLNVACIGNIVRQMHIHIVGRSRHDPAWPGTVWACDAKQPYPPETVATIRQAAQKALALTPPPPTP